MTKRFEGAHEVSGERFAINGDALTPVASGSAASSGPDSLPWHDMGVRHSAFKEWALTGDLETLYRYPRRQRWEAEAAAPGPDEGIAVLPYVLSVEAQLDLSGTSRRSVLVAELCHLHAEAAGRLSDSDGRRR